MKDLQNNLVIGVRYNPEIESGTIETGNDFYYLHIWHLAKSHQPTIIPVPYRGGFHGGFNDLFLERDKLFVADGEGILCFDLKDLSEDYLELNDVNEISDQSCKTSKHLISGLHHILQVRSLEQILTTLEEVEPLRKVIDVPYQDLEYRSFNESDTILSLLPIGLPDGEKVLLNNADDKSFLFDSSSLQAEEVQDRTSAKFPYTFQRREKYHFVSLYEGNYLVLTESTSDKQHPNRIYSLSIRAPPTVKELEPLEFPGKQILSINKSSDNYLQLLKNCGNKTLIEQMDPVTKEVKNSRKLKRKYELGDRLQQVEDQLLIVRHLEDEIVDVETEDSVKLSGAENNVAIPEISSTWRYPQYLYVERLSNGLKKL